MIILRYAILVSLIDISLHEYFNTTNKEGFVNKITWKLNLFYNRDFVLKDSPINDYSRLCGFL